MNSTVSESTSNWMTVVTTVTITTTARVTRTTASLAISTGAYVVIRYVITYRKLFLFSK